MKPGEEASLPAGRLRPTIDAIARGDFVENERLEFKRQLNLDETGRQKLIDVVVAFLNRGGGTILERAEPSLNRLGIPMGGWL